jgi:hypothetical protein
VPQKAAGARDLIASAKLRYRHPHRDLIEVRFTAQ